MQIALYIPIIFASLALSGWLFKIELMKQVWLPSVAMNPTTASCILLLSCGLLVNRVLQQRAHPLAIFLLSAAFIIGALKTSDVWFGTHIGIDSYLFHDQLLLQKGGPSRMAPNSALCFMILSVASILFAIQQTTVVPTQVLALGAMFAPFIAILGYTYGVAYLYEVTEFIPMALPTAICIILLSLYILHLTGTTGILEAILDAGPSGKAARLLLPVSIISPVLIGWLRLQGQRAGFFNLELGLAIMVTVNILIFSILIWWHAHELLISDRLRSLAERDLAHAATHDFLTGLANRAMFMERLTSRVAAIQRRQQELFGVIYLDIDGFKQVNDQLGHAAGDQLLRQIANILHKSVRSEDLVARLGGDEFTILLDRIDHADDIEKVTVRIYADMPQSVKQVPVGLSMGIVIGDKRHVNPEALLYEADRALYTVKRSGKGKALLYAPQQQ